MSDYGSGWLAHYGKVKKQSEHFKSIHNNIIAKSQGVSYNPPHAVDRGVVAMVDINMVARAQYYISAGGGTFQEWITAKFLEFHRHDKQLGSKITVCL